MEKNQPSISPDQADAEHARLEKLICKLAWRFAKKYGIPFEDACSEAHYAFVRAFDSFKPDKGMLFSSWVYFKCNMDLRNFVARRMKRPVFISIEEQEVEERPEEKSRWKDTFENLSEDAKAVVSMLLETPDELIGSTRKALARAREEVSFAQGIAEPTFANAIDEIKTKIFHHVWG